MKNKQEIIDEIKRKTRTRELDSQKPFVDIERAIQAHDAAKRVSTRDLPAPPYLQTYPISDRFMKMGEDLGVAPLELQTIFNDAMDVSNPLLSTAIKKMIINIKMCDSVDFSPLRKQVASVENTNKCRTADWEQKCQEVKKHNAKVAEDIHQTHVKASELWKNMVEQIDQQVKMENELIFMSEWNRGLMRCLSEISVTSIAIVDKPGDQVRHPKAVTISGDKVFFSKGIAELISFSNISHLDKNIRRQIHEERKETYKRWLDDASIQDLQTAISLSRDQEEQFMLEQVIAARRGFYLVWNEEGEEQWMDEESMKELIEIQNRRYEEEIKNGSCYDEPEWFRWEDPYEVAERAFDNFSHATPQFAF